MIAAVPVIAALAGDISMKTLCSAPEGTGRIDGGGSSSNVDLGNACEKVGARDQIPELPFDICFHIKDSAWNQFPFSLHPQKDGV